MGYISLLANHVENFLAIVVRLHPVVMSTFTYRFLLVDWGLSSIAIVWDHVDLPIIKWRGVAYLSHV